MLVICEQSQYALWHFKVFTLVTLVAKQKLEAQKCWENWSKYTTLQKRGMYQMDLVISFLMQLVKVEIVKRTKPSFVTDVNIWKIESPPPYKKGYPLRHPFLSTPATLLSQAKTKQYFCEKCINNATQFTQFSFTLFFCHKNLSEKVLVSLFVC